MLHLVASVTCRPVVEVQRFLLAGHALEPEALHWLCVTAVGNVVSFAAGISAIPRKTWKIFRYGRLPNPSRRATWLRRCFLELPTVAMMDLRPSGIGASVLEVCLHLQRT